MPNLQNNQDVIDRQLRLAKEYYDKFPQWKKDWYESQRTKRRNGNA